MDKKIEQILTHVVCNLQRAVIESSNTKRDMPTRLGYLEAEVESAIDDLSTLLPEDLEGEE